jgi:glyoxylase-like metal-dependent hydrolase (beta-lactamase superfamily II)
MLDSVIHRDASAHAPRFVANDVSYLIDKFVNVCFVGAAGAGDREWALVDAGLPGSADKIKRAAARLFGADSRPAAILLTHGHIDHVGAIHTLTRDWDAPVYAHEMELPYLTGRSSYPPPDPFVGGGAMSVLSLLFPRGPFNLGSRIHAMPADGRVPGMHGWRWIPTPGHTPGHVSFVRDADRTLIAGDAFCTQKNESLIKALTHQPEMHGPPMYFTPDWDSARESVRHLADYAPTAAITGHGPAMRGPQLQAQLRQLASRFDELARPAHGRYRDRPAIADINGIVEVPPPEVSARTVVLSGLALGATIGLAVALSRRAGNRAGQTLDTADELALAQGAELAAADGGYEVSRSPIIPSASARPYSVDLR